MREQHNKLKVRIEETVGKITEPFTTYEVVKRTGIPWITTKEILLELVLQGKIKAMKTTNGYIFFPRGEKIE